MSQGTTRRISRSPATSTHWMMALAAGLLVLTVAASL